MQGMFGQQPQLERQAGAMPVRRAVPPALLFGVGAPKCGTSWLHGYLYAHPDCHFRALKELHYFDAFHAFRVDWVLDYLEARLRRVEQLAVTARAELRSEFMREAGDIYEYYQLIKNRVDDRAGYSKYLLRGNQGAKVVGDITPAYALLPTSVLREMASMTAHSRFVYLVREPVERLWSHVRMSARQVKSAEADYDKHAQTIFADLLAGRVEAHHQMLEYSDYSGAIGRMSEAVPEDRLLVLCQEQMMTPRGIRKLCSFLGIRYVKPNFKQTANLGKSAHLPSDLRSEARKMLKSQYEFAQKYFGKLPENWQKSISKGFA